MKREQLEELGFVVKAELADEDIKDYLFVVEDCDGDIEVLHFYLNGLHLEPTVDIYFLNSFRKRERNKLRKDPQRFIENFNRYMVCNMPDAYVPVEIFIKNARLLRKKGLTNFV